MPVTKQFHIFHGRDDFSSDQLDLITAEVKKRQHTLYFALKNLQSAVEHSPPQPRMARKAEVKVRKKPISKQLSISSASNANLAQVSNKKALKGQVSYKVKGQGGRLMNIAEIKKWVDSLYDGGQGIVKQ
jgi:hypothetical protein